MERIIENHQPPVDKLIEIAQASTPDYCRLPDTAKQEMKKNHYLLKEYLKRYPSLTKALCELIELDEESIPIVVDAESNLVLSLYQQPDNKWKVRALVSTLTCTSKAIHSLTDDIDEAKSFSVDVGFEERMWKLSKEHEGGTLNYNPDYISPQDYVTAALFYFDNEPLRSTFDLEELF